VRRALIGITLRLNQRRIVPLSGEGGGHPSEKLVKKQNRRFKRTWAWLSARAAPSPWPPWLPRGLHSSAEPVETLSTSFTQAPEVYKRVTISSPF
jgi:hypothetical protein